MPRPRRNLIDVWAAACPKCEAIVGQPCRDLRKRFSPLYGRRTHRERALKIKEQKPMAIIMRPLLAAGGQTSTTTGYFTMTPNSTWNAWAGGNNYAITTTANTTWDRWLTTGTGATGTTVHYDPAYTWREWEGRWEVEQYRPPAIHQPTQAELDAMQRRREDQSARLLAEQQRIAVAQPRALELFRSLLTEPELRQMDDDGEVWVKGSAGGIYAIETRDGRVHGNIRAIDEHGCMLGRLCVQPSMYAPEEGGALPTADGHVGQLLAIRFNEPALLAKANWSSRQRCQQPALRVA